jgi:hypothetical protein
LPSPSPSPLAELWLAAGARFGGGLMASSVAADAASSTTTTAYQIELRRATGTHVKMCPVLTTSSSVLSVNRHVGAWVEQRTWREDDAGRARGCRRADAEQARGWCRQRDRVLTKREREDVWQWRSSTLLQGVLPGGPPPHHHEMERLHLDAPLWALAAPPTESGQPRESGCKTSCRATTARGLALDVGVATTRRWRTGCLSGRLWEERNRWRETAHREEYRPEVEGETDVWAPSVFEWRERSTMGLLVHTKECINHIHLRVGPMVLHTHIMAWFKESQSCNGTSPNTWIVVFQNLKNCNGTNPNDPWKCENYVNEFVLQNTPIKVYICQFLIIIEVKLCFENCFPVLNVA